ncbi:hypothetical protein [Leptothoe sp. PORK10 BA2]|uniref:hypothetical protein n=1 Tax=Leptothoe sp. PORK10 BA2 TaxID=3110254 RepID=UPI002B1F31C0|nr:hypothetical protein [Leptothoe sp. PORK10 BA2]MEA5466478.1 hypothetical protein [Leptothoe sp. PORK10 BA2]
MNYTITESQKTKIIDALRFAADTANVRVAREWNKLADYLEVLDPGTLPSQSPEKSTSR